MEIEKPRSKNLERQNYVIDPWTDTINCEIDQIIT